ncbi:CHAT domain-containing protein [Janthinobacterium sp. SUN206]|uniref:CHAT domain-containing protein n=1 Tax=Janthinobacterium sp. SUN206 TaxID=3014787 RepID=UPI0027140B1B|nr:CHAT domain-containing protein [Janthinobacterium sp. SUN206]MDO8066971.1 CHAT domain-containing protein [Janthinobacterium sp. SUN206]
MSSDPLAPPVLRLTLTRDPLASAGDCPAAPGWHSQTHVLSGARGIGSCRIALDIGPDDVVQLLLCDGSSLLAGSLDLPRYLGPATLARDGAPASIEVGLALRPQAARPPPGASRDGLGAWMLRAVRVYRCGGAAMTALAAAGAFQDRQLEQRLGLYRCGIEAGSMTAVASLTAGPEPLLLLLHGTASSTQRSFAGLWRNGLAPQLAAQYGNRIYGYEHRSLSDSPIENALALVRQLPHGAVLHLLSHSRGGLVGELLARAQRIDSRGAVDLAGDGLERLSENTVGGEAFNSHDIDHFTAQARLGGRGGYDGDAARLRDLSMELKTRAIRIARFVRVACPARGTTLMSGRLDRWASAMFNLLLHGGLPDGAMAFLLAVVQQRCDARILPGLEAMMPDSPLVALLNAPDVRVASPLHVLAGACSGDGLLGWLGDCLDDQLYGGQNDLVVNCASMAGGATRSTPVRQLLLRGPHAHHLNYFERAPSGLAAVQALTGDETAYLPLPGIEHGPLARGGEVPKRRAHAPIVLLLPDIMGSHLQVGSNRIWFDPVNLVEGRIERLAVGQPHIVSAGWVESCYEPFARFLAQSQEVRPFAYDWRLSLQHSGNAFLPVLDEAMRDAEQRGQPLRIVAHGMGGLVARLALKDRWQRFGALPGSRLLQVGTANRGTQAMVQVLLGRDRLVQMLACWIGWKHTRRQFLGFVRAFPGVLDMLPWPQPGGIDYFDAGAWAQLAAGDAQAGLPGGWQAPEAQALAAARATVALLEAAPPDARHCSYLAGCADTPVALRLRDGGIETAWSPDGDGRTAWQGAVPDGVAACYLPVAHGDLLLQKEYYPAIAQLLDSGQGTGLPRHPPHAPGGAPPRFHPYAPDATPLYPQPQELLDAALGAAGPAIAPERRAPQLSLSIIHGSMASADAPVMSGCYAAESLRGSMSFLDRLLAGKLQEIHALGRFPQRPDSALVVLQPDAARRPGGAIVIGLGALGELTPGELARAFAGGLLEYACVCLQVRAAGHAAAPPMGEHGLRVASLLSGSGYGGLSIALCARALLDGARSANRRLEDAGMACRIGHIAIYEQSEARAIAAAMAIEQIMAEARYQGSFTFEQRIRHSPGGYRRILPSLSGDNGWRRVQIVAADLSGALRFTVLTDRAHNSVDEEPNQRQAVDGLIMDATDNTTDQPGLSRALYELMLPNGLKAAIPEMRGLILAVDQSAAIYPWELMRDEAGSEESPLSTRIGMVRQLASLREQPSAVSPPSNSVLVIGDTDSGLPELPAAQAEAQDVARMFGAYGYQVRELLRPQAQRVLVHLFDERYFAIHLAGHGEVAGPGIAHTGLVLGPKTRLTAAQVGKLKRVPQFVFINCCHLGDMRPDAIAPWSKLAASLATAFIEMGSQAVIAAGWRIDDQAASIFAHSFYHAMLSGEYFGDAVRLAREAAYLQFPASNTWGAYQAYGDDRYRFPNTQSRPWQAPDYHYHGHLLADLETLHARLAGADAARRAAIEEKLGSIEEAVRARFFGCADIRENMAATRAGLGGLENTLRAIEHYRAAHSAADGKVGLRALAHWAELEIRQGAALCGLDAGAGIEVPAVPDLAQGRQLLQDGKQHIDLLVALAPTAQRLALLGRYWALQARLACRAGSSGAPALRAMTDACLAALEEARRRSGVADCDLIFQVLAGALLLKAHGDSGAWRALDPQLGDLLHDAIAYARQRHADEHRAIDAGAPVRAALLAALWQAPDGQPFDASARTAFLALYHDAVRRHGSIGEPEAITAPLRFLLELLPPDGAESGLRSAVQALASQLQASLPGIHFNSLNQAPRHSGAHSARPDSPAASS